MRGVYFIPACKFASSSSRRPISPLLASTSTRSSRQTRHSLRRKRVEPRMQAWSAVQAHTVRRPSRRSNQAGQPAVSPEQGKRSLFRRPCVFSASRIVRSAPSGSVVSKPATGINRFSAARQSAQPAFQSRHQPDLLFFFHPLIGSEPLHQRPRRARYRSNGVCPHDMPLSARRSRPDSEAPAAAPPHRGVCRKRNLSASVRIARPALHPQSSRKQRRTVATRRAAAVP